MSKATDDEVVTAYPNYKPKSQTQSLPGADHEMDPLAEHIQLEFWDESGKPFLKEYQGMGLLQGKKALITGGDSGIGRSVAIMMAREGADVSIVYLKEEQKDAEKVKELISKAPHGSKECFLIPADLMDPKSAEEIVKKHVSQYKRIDILVNNAGKQIMCKELEKIDLDQVDSTFKSNILGMIYLTKFALPHMKRGASIVNSTSVTAYQGSPGLIDYSSTKGAIVTFTRSLAGQLAPKGIRVNAVAPGPVYTPLQPASRPAENMEGWEIGSLPLHGRPGQPAELGPSYVFLAGPHANFITGQTLHVNAGQWMGS